MTKKENRGVLLFDKVEPKISGYLIIGDDHYQIIGQKVSDIRTNLTIKKIAETADEKQTDLFDGRSSQSGARKCDLA